VDVYAFFPAPIIALCGTPYVFVLVQGISMLEGVDQCRIHGHNLLYNVAAVRYTLARMGFTGCNLFDMVPPNSFTRSPKALHASAAAARQNYGTMSWRCDFPPEISKQRS
jgi:hypothetical protein